MKCIRCNKEHNRIRSRFCSYKCFKLSKNEILYKYCKLCNKKFEYKLSDKDGKYSYKKVMCSKKCNSKNAYNYAKIKLNEIKNNNLKKKYIVIKKCLFCKKKFSYYKIDKGVSILSKNIRRKHISFCSTKCSCSNNLLKAINNPPINYHNFMKNKTFEQIYGKENAKKIKEKLKKNSYMTKLGKHKIEERLGVIKGRKFKENVSKGLKKTEKNKGKNNPAYGKIYYPKLYYDKNLKHYIRSSWEKDFALILKKLKINYLYEYKKFKLSNGTTYTPDFYLIDKDIYIEIKGAIFDYQIKKIKLFLKEYNKKYYILGNIRKSTIKLFKKYNLNIKMLDFFKKEEICKQWQ